ncbi:hypothetical protein BD408DRAFT_399466 [Parasitella parasitica]|nr:hypothetical protein BD408DRAFT_399466 [Parasitella parasitica]
MTLNDEQIKKPKKFAVGELPPSPTTSTGTIATTAANSKRATRHHVKRRSSGRVHVSKLAPMAKAHGSNNNEESDERKPIKRSQSNKSLTRLPSQERKVGMAGLTPAVDNTANTTSKEQEEQEEQEEQVVKEVISPQSPPTTPPSTATAPLDKKPTFHVSHTIPAAPVEQPLHVTADSLVLPDKKSTITPTGTSTSTINNPKKPLLKSQFVEHSSGNSSSKKICNVASAAIAQQPSEATASA